MWDIHGENWEQALKGWLTAHTRYLGHYFWGTEIRKHSGWNDCRKGDLRWLLLPLSANILRQDIILPYLSAFREVDKQTNREALAKAPLGRLAARPCSKRPQKLGLFPLMGGQRGPNGRASFARSPHMPCPHWEIDAGSNGELVAVCLYMSFYFVPAWDDIQRTRDIVEQ
jgi:hypothetical protein